MCDQVLPAFFTGISVFSVRKPWYYGTNYSYSLLNLTLDGKKQDNT